MKNESDTIETKKYKNGKQQNEIAKTPESFLGKYKELCESEGYELQPIIQAETSGAIGTIKAVLIVTAKK